ncbi:hypothetical protein RHGRI_005772 [Rhododendron griersonianum]|uniref:Neprosin PEP catalytic domain-containing protein n=1 Tax=Rhododendron griersonianum TaxID=479676 RepID=A0AAV6LEI9_9ERIC|nr:hypothetical protein RHGRI_005772 [Rhododendron griersonianum]
MSFRAFLLVLFLSPLLLGYNGVEGARELLEREDMELEKQLKLLNKPAVKTIETEYGDTYDCVDFYKQPAFDHPLLKNHSFHFQMKPTLSLKRNRDQVSSRVRESAHIELKGGGCPVGTVPIRRITKEDLIRERNASKLMSFADNAIGAHVDPTLYGDTRTRRFIRLDAGQSHCFNTRCPGFVQVRSDKLLDLVYPQVSKRGELGYEAPLFIDRDLVNGNWWLLVGESNTEVGFWPKRIFSGLADLASYAEWGGEVFYPPGTPIPEMGSGFPLPLVRDTKYDAYLRNVEVVNAAGQNINAYNTETFEDTRIYGVVDLEHTKLGHLVLYGGGGRQ